MIKGQAATEFLMTYGWALLVVVAMILALSVFGVQRLNVAKPDICIMQIPFACLDSTFDGNSLNMVLINNGGMNINNVNISIIFKEKTVQCDQLSTLPSGKQVTVGCLITDTLMPGSFNADIRISYLQEASNLAHENTGTVSFNVQ